MADIEFYASPDDLRGLLSWLFADQPALRVCEAYSRYDRELITFDTASQLAAYLDDEPHSGFVVLRDPELIAISIRRVELKVPGHRFRYTAGGWGLMSFYLGKTTAGGIRLSRLCHLEPRGAARQASGSDLETPLPTPEQWAALKRCSGRIIRHIRRTSVGKAGIKPWCILPNAERMRRAGVPLCLQNGVAERA